MATIALSYTLFVLCLCSHGTWTVRGEAEIHREKREFGENIQIESLMVRVSTLEVNLFRAQQKARNFEKQLSEMRTNQAERARSSSEGTVLSGDILKTATQNVKQGLYMEKAGRVRLEESVEELKDALHEQRENTGLLTGKIQLIEKTIPSLRSSLAESVQCCRHEIKGSQLKNLTDALEAERGENGKWRERFQSAINLFPDMRKNISHAMKCCSQARTDTTTTRVGDKEEAEKVQPVTEGPVQRYGVQFSGVPLNHGDPRLADDCADLWDMGYKKNGPYRIQLDDTTSVVVKCNLQETTRNWNVANSYAHMRGWLVVQKRTHGEENFNRTWDEYKRGFGNLSDEFWVGNEILWHFLNSSDIQPCMFLRLYSPHYFYYYRFFASSGLRMMSEEEGFKLEYKGFSYGQETKEQTPARGPFMTWDKQTPRHTSCPPVDGGWWYLNPPGCTYRQTNANSKYENIAKKNDLFRGYLHSFSKARHGIKSRHPMIISGSELLIHARKPLKPQPAN